MEIFVKNLNMKYMFPCSNGVACYNEKTKSIAIIDVDGGKKVETYPTKNKLIFFNWFLLRGLQYFFCGITALFSSFDMSYGLCKTEESKISKSISKTFFISARYFFMLISVVISFIIAYLFLGFLPAKLSFFIVGNSANLQLRAFIIAGIKVVLFYLILLILRFLPFMQYFYRFNGAISQIMNKKHKDIKLNWHNPLNFVNFMVFALLFSVFMVSLIAVNLSWWANLLINLLIIAFCIAFSYEFLLILNKSNIRWINLVCLVTSWFVCIKPNITQEEIAKVALLESDMGKDKKLSAIGNGMIALSAVYTEMQTKLESVGRYEKSDVDWIIATILDKNRTEIKLIHSIPLKQYHEIMKATERRVKGEPLSNIFGFVDFYGLRFDVNKKVLSPRMETELLVSEALKIIKDNDFKEVCDLCTGSGAIAVSIAKNASVKICGIDISKQALQVAENNAKKHGVKIEFIESDLFAVLKKAKKFDIIVSNPPYIESAEIDKLDEEVKKYDPKLALDGGKDGLDFYREITLQSVKKLNKNGVLMFELGQGQASAVRKMMKEAGFVDTRVVKDYNKIERIIYGKVRS